jgi:hypothetical protein
VSAARRNFNRRCRRESPTIRANERLIHRCCRGFPSWNAIEIRVAADPDGNVFGAMQYDRSAS